MKNVLNNKLLIVIIFFAFILRVVSLSSFPIGFTQDEAALGYDAYSLLETGRDQWGEAFPLSFRSFGDFKMPLYTYLAAPSVHIFGLNVFAVRLPNAIFGTLAVLATYLMVLELTKRKNFALLSSLFMALSPWGISLSRGAFEANLTTFFIPIGVWAFYKAIKDPRWAWVAACSFGINIFSYHSARLFTPFLILIMVLLNRKVIYKNLLSKAKNKNFLRNYLIGLFILAIFFLVSIYTLRSGSQMRAFDVVIFNPTDKWAAVADRRYEAVLQGVPDYIARTFSNKATYVSRLFASNYISYLSPVFFFTQGAGGWGYGMIPGRGVLYMFEAILLLVSMISYIKGKGFKNMNLILLWVIISPMAAALAKGPGYAANRAAVMMPAIQVLSVYGLVVLYKYAKSMQKVIWKKIFVVSTILIMLVSFISFLEDYIYHAPINGARSMQWGTKEAIDYVSNVEGNYDEVLVSRSLSVPQIWVAFYQKYDPTEIQEASKEWLDYEKEGWVAIDQLGEYRLGKYVFGAIDLSVLRESTQKILIVGKPEEFKWETNTLKTIVYPNGKPAYSIMDNSMLK